MVRLTDTGRTVLEAAAPAHVENVRCHVFDLLSEDELETLGTVFDRVLEHLPAPAAPPSPGHRR
jgi:DNA-binding MarR family transcriptional regulator